MVTEAEKEIWASIEPQSIEPTSAWRYQARSSPAAQFKTSSGVIISQVSFIDTEERMPNKRAGDVEERCLGIWIMNNKFSEKGTNSERAQLMRREIPLAFVDNSRPVQDVKWRDNLASAKTFIDTEERMPNKRAGDVEERRLGSWIVSNKSSEKGTNSEREQLMRREIPLAFANQ
jgi:hypothetical protein